MSSLLEKNFQNGLAASAMVFNGKHDRVADMFLKDALIYDTTGQNEAMCRFLAGCVSGTFGVWLGEKGA